MAKFHKNLHVTNPSEVTESYWLHARPPLTQAALIERGCMKWVTEKGQQYADSGRIYPREIYHEELAVPTREPELTLRNIDLEALNGAMSFMKSPDRALNDLTLLPVAGKWLIYVPRTDIDGVWNRLASAIDRGQLPYNAKVSTRKDNKLSDDKDLHVVCVYSPNFLFRDDVRKCRAILSELGFEDVLYYKPDVMTYKKMYRITGSKINHRYFG